MDAVISSRNGLVDDIVIVDIATGVVTVVLANSALCCYRSIGETFCIRSVIRSISR